jgi:hypothetical protein
VENIQKQSKPSREFYLTSSIDTVNHTIELVLLYTTSLSQTFALDY